MFSPLAFSARRWSAQAALFSVGVVVEGHSPPQKVGGTAALGPATRLLGLTEIGRADRNDNLAYVISRAARGGEDRPEGTHLWRVVAPSRENLTGHVVGTYPVLELWKAAAFNGAETVSRLG